MENIGLYFYGLAATVFVVTSLIIAAVRWFHMCRPYDRNPRYYYPARPAITMIYLSSVVLIPYVINPDSHTAWLIVKTYFLPVDIYFITILLFSYFGGVKQWRKWRVPTIALGIIAALTMLTAVSWTQSDVYDGTLDIIETIIIGIAAVMTIVCFWAVTIVVRWARNANNEDYSNPDDFPVSFACRALLMLIPTVVLQWAAALSDSKAAMAALQLYLSVASVALLISALHPHRQTNPIKDQDMEESINGKRATKGKNTPYYSRNLPNDKVQEIIKAIREEMEQRKAFLEPHLTMQDVASRIGYNRTYVAAVFKNHLGGFFTYVNTLRLDYADEYRNKHPKASVIEISNESGFNSRTTYYAVQAKIRPDK
jgi:AraC-like DNA-binding protein